MLYFACHTQVVRLTENLQGTHSLSQRGTKKVSHFCGRFLASDRGYGWMMLCLSFG